MLVDVAEAEQLGPGRTHISHLQRHGFTQRLLNIHVVILDIRRADLGVYGPCVRGGAEAGENRRASDDGGSYVTGRADCGRSYAVVCRTRIKCIEWEVADEKILGERVIVKPPSGADHGVAVAP